MVGASLLMAVGKYSRKVSAAVRRFSSDRYAEFQSPVLHEASVQQAG
jgi:hypothetical protein